MRAVSPQAISVQPHSHKYQQMASKLRPTRVTLANLRPAPGSQHNVRPIFIVAATTYVFPLYSKSVSVVVKGQGMEEPLVVAIKAKTLVLVQESNQVLREGKPRLPSYSPSADLLTRVSLYSQNRSILTFGIQEYKDLCAS